MAYVPPWKRAAAASSAAPEDPVRGPASMPETGNLNSHVLAKRFGFPQTGTLTPFAFPAVIEERVKRSEGASWVKGEEPESKEGETEGEPIPEAVQLESQPVEEQPEQIEQPAPVEAEETPIEEEEEDDDENAKEIPLPGQDGAELGRAAPVKVLADLSLASPSEDEPVDPSFTVIPTRRKNGPAHHPHGAKIAYITLFNSQPQFPKELWCHSNAALLTDPKGKYENWGKLVPVYKSLGKVHGFKFEGWWRIKSAKAVVPGSEELIKMLEAKEAMRNYSLKGRDPAAWKESLAQTWIKVYGAKLSINDVLRLKLKDPLQIKGEPEDVQQYLLQVRDTQ